MEIIYTYKEPTDRPIASAEFESSTQSNCVIRINSLNEVYINFFSGGRLFIPADFADFTVLVNRINRQINGVSE